MSCESRLLPDYGPVFRKESRAPFVYLGLGACKWRLRFALAAPS